MEQQEQQKKMAPAQLGLTEREAQARMAQGRANRTSDTGGKTAGEIIKSNVLTYFNLIFAIIARRWFRHCRPVRIRQSARARPRGAGR